MYIIDNDNIIHLENNNITVPLRSGMDLSTYSWIDSKLIQMGILYIDNKVYYRDKKTAEFIRDNIELSKLYNSSNIVIFINNRIDFYKRIRDLMNDTNTSEIVKHHESIQKLINEYNMYLDFFIGYSESLLTNNHYTYCCNIQDKYPDVGNFIDNIDNGIEFLFLKDCKMLIKFDDYCDSILKQYNQLCDILYKTYLYTKGSE